VALSAEQLAGLEARATALHADAARHKRLARFHRRQAQAHAAQLARLRADLARMGVRLVIPGEAPQEERHGHAASSRSA
jgi:hypothetical protein